MLQKSQPESYAKFKILYPVECIAHGCAGTGIRKDANMQVKLTDERF